MKKLQIWSMVGLMGLAFSAVAELKVAVLDVQTAVLSSDEAKKFIEQVKKETGPDEEKLKCISEEGRKLQERMQKDGPIMSEDEKRKLAEKIEEKAVNYKYLVGKLQSTQRDKQQELLSKMNPKVEKAVTEIIKAEQFDLVLQRQAVVYAVSALDITAKVTDRINQQK